MALATLEQGMGLVLTALAAPLPAAPVTAHIVPAVETFDLATFSASTKILRIDRGYGRAIHSYPTDLDQVPVDDALPPPQILWTPTPMALVKIVPAKVRFNMNF